MGWCRIKESASSHIVFDFADLNGTRMNDLSSPKPPPSLAQAGIPADTYELMPLDGLRQTIARRMTDSFRDVPHFPLVVDVEIDALNGLRAQLNQEGDGAVKISVNDLIVRACALALAQVPAANASYTPEGIALHRQADIAIAVAIDGGLVTPIVRGAGAKPVRQIAAESKDLVARARAMKLSPREYKGGTFSVSNLGMFGIRQFASILNQPQGCILSVGAAEQRPVVKDGQLAVATVMTLTLTCDHRVVDGAVGARLLQVLKQVLEDARRTDFDPAAQA
jgi:pyruvate dehydrogenase E2 component (dihydrolipoamide acetyltransferase)